MFVPLTLLSRRPWGGGFKAGSRSEQSACLSGQRCSQSPPRLAILPVGWNVRRPNELRHLIDRLRGYFVLRVARGSPLLACHLFADLTSRLMNADYDLLDRILVEIAFSLSTEISWLS
jgi:hypothetical protein